jgi:NitT/TauT family transport system permease protein
MSTPAPPFAAPPALHDNPLSEPIPQDGTFGQKARAVAAVVVPPLLVFVFFIGVWELASEVFIHPEKRFLLPPPQDIIKTGFLDHQNITEILNGLWITTKAALIGLALSVVIGMGLAIAMSQAKWVERSLFPYAVILQTIPILALVPLIGFVIGFNFPSRVLVCVLISLFPIITNTLFGLLSADQGQHDLFTLFRVNRWTRLYKLQLPAAMPAIFTGFRTSAGLAVVGAVVGDFFFKQGDPGIGVLIDLYSSQLESERLYAAVILASLLGVVIFVLVGFLNDRIVGRWAPSTRGGSS